MNLEQRNRRTLLFTLTFVAFMVGLSFAAVPLYDLFCRVTGFAGTPMIAQAMPNETRDRVITIRFNADINQNLPWEFKPRQHSVQGFIGEPFLAYYDAVNKGSDDLIGTAVFNVTPLKAGKYFHKVYCFCFERQPLAPGEGIEFPVSFYIDPAMADDPMMDDVSTVTLSYTFFKAKNQSRDNLTN